MWPSIIYIVVVFLTGEILWPLRCITQPGILEYILLAVWISSFFW